MSKAENILRQQQGNQTVVKTAEESARIAKAELEKHEAEVKKAAINAGFDPADPIKGFHDAVAAFNKEKDELDKRQQICFTNSSEWMTNYNTNLERLNAEEQRFRQEVAAQQAKQKELVAKSIELDNKKKELQLIVGNIAAKQTELDNIKELTNRALRKCSKLVLEAERRRDEYQGLALAEYDEALASSWDKFLTWIRNLFRDLRL